MKKGLSMKLAYGTLMAAALVVAQSGNARTITVQMKNNGPGTFMVFEPALIKANVGDIVHFVSADPGHNAETIDGMIPTGVPRSGGKISQPFDLKISKPGLYGVKCVPHFSMGMVALIRAGTGPAPNAGSARAAKLPPLAAKRMAKLLDAAG